MDIKSKVNREKRYYAQFYIFLLIIDLSVFFYLKDICTDALL